jgi:NTE family protein
VFEAVQIDGVPYWDGGYVGNPVIWPLIYHTDADDILLVQVNPLVRETTPTRLPDIVNRLNEITFNASLIAEMRAIHFVIKLMRENKLDVNRYKHVRMHAVNLADVMENIDASTKDNTDIEFLRMLHAKGREAADRWLRAHKGDIGVRETIDIEKTFLMPPEAGKKKIDDEDVDTLAAPKLPDVS